MERALQIVSIIVSIMLIILVLLQAKGNGVGNLLGGGGDAGGGIARTRRGLEKTLFQVTIGLAVIFILVSIFSVAVFNGAA